MSSSLFGNGNNEQEDVRVLCTMKPESVMSEKGHFWKTILSRGLCGLVIIDYSALYLGINIYVQAASQSTLRRHLEHSVGSKHN